MKLFILGLFTLFNSTHVFGNCDSGRMILNKERNARVIGGPQPSRREGSIWVYKLLRPRVLYRFCADFPVIDAGRKPRYNHKYRDQLIAEIIPPPVVPGLDIHFAIIDPKGHKFIEAAKYYSAYRTFRIPYRRKGEYILEVMILDEKGWLYDGQYVELAFSIKEYYGGMKLDRKSFIRTPTDFFPDDVKPFIGLFD